MKQIYSIQEDDYTSFYSNLQLIINRLMFVYNAELVTIIIDYNSEIKFIVQRKNTVGSEHFEGKIIEVIN